MCEFCSNQYHLDDTKWGTGEFGEPGGIVNWSFATSAGNRFDFSEYITDEVYRDIVRNAFQAWEDVANIDFVEVADSAESDIRLGWDTIDGAFGVVGEAATRGSNISSTLFSYTEAEIRFDIAENWITSGEVPGNAVGFFQVALHEIGHAIGLEHTTDPNTIMFASDISGIPGLTPGDIAGAQAFYGPAAGFVAPGTPTDGNDTFAASAGDDVIDGLGGTDTLTLTGDQSQYTLALSAGNIILTDRQGGRDGTDTLVNIEQLQFQDAGFTIDTFDGITGLSATDFAQIVELYIAYFNRAPDAVGLAFWGNAFADGLSMQDMAALFIDQDETRATYPASMSNDEVATAVYNNVLGRIPDADGFDFWVGVLDGGTVGRDTFILSVLEGAKAEIPAGASQSFIDQVMIDRQYLADKADIGAYFAVHKGMSDVADASAAMALFDGSAGSIQDAVSAIDGHYADALNAGSGDFLLPIVGVLDDPFAV